MVTGQDMINSSHALADPKTKHRFMHRGNVHDVNPRKNSWTQTVQLSHTNDDNNTFIEFELYLFEDSCMQARPTERLRSSSPWGDAASFCASYSGCATQPSHSRLHRPRCRTRASLFPFIFCSHAVQAWGLCVRNLKDLGRRCWEVLFLEAAPSDCPWPLALCD